MKPRRLIILMSLFLLSSFCPFPAEGSTKTYRWPDFSKPFGNKAGDVSAGNPRVVEVDLPAAVADSSKVSLLISSEIPRADSLFVRQHIRGIVYVNGRAHYFPLGRKEGIALGRGALKSGLNSLRFETDSTTARWSYDLLDLQFMIEGADAHPVAAPPVSANAPAGQQPVAKPYEAPAQPAQGDYRWEDYTKPFKTRVGVSSGKPKSVQVDLPAAVVNSGGLPLYVSTTALGGSYSYGIRIILYINGKALAPFTSGPNLKLVLERTYLRAGLNTFRFDCFGTADRFEVYDLRWDLPDALAHAPQPSPAPIKAEEAPAPAAPEKVKTSAAPAATAPAAVKPDETQPHVVPERPAPDQPIPVESAGDPGQRWAVVIGVSSYEDSRIPALRYATRDAQVFYDWLVAPGGGRYAPSKVKLLLDRNATNERIKDALFNWLKQAIEEDVVVIYFAGHGSPESPDAHHNLYLLPYNTKYDNIAVTGFPMWDIETALKRFIKAKRVVIIADACHAAGVGQAFDVAVRADRGLQVNPINSGLQNLTDIGEGVCVISASRDREFSQEGREWGGGHGVFSYYLIEGLKGAADFDRSGSVSIGEVTVYVSQQVRRATRNAQNPVVAGRFDPSLVIGK